MIRASRLTHALFIILFLSQQFSIINGHHHTIQENLDLSNVKTWAYQLQGADPDQIAASGFDLIVMDYSVDGTEETKYTPQEIQKIKNAGIIPIAYISIGEAEDYRFYWQDEWYTNPPEWLGNENPEWPGNYPVKYWYNEWKQIIFSYLDKIIEQGFEGVYLDRIDSFEYWSDPNNGEDIYLPEKEAAIRMIEFVEEIARYCREIKGLLNFYIIPQNGERILEYDENGTYLGIISGIGIEDLWYNGIDPIPPEITNSRILYIDMVAKANKPVFSVDYVDDGSGYSGENKERIDDYYSKALAKGYIPYAARVDRELDELNIIEGIQPRKDNREEPSIFSTYSQYWLMIIPIATIIIIITFQLYSKKTLIKLYLISFKKRNKISKKFSCICV